MKYWPVPYSVLRVAYDILAFTAGLVLVFFFPWQLVIVGILSSDNNYWVAIIGILLLLAILGLFIGGVYSKKFLAYKKGEKIKRIILINSAVFLLFSFFYFVFFPSTIAQAMHIILAWLVTTFLLLFARFASRIFEIIYAREIGAGYRKPIESDKNTVLVTGGGGYVGSALVPKLLDAGYNVRVLDLFLFGEKPIEAFKDHPNVTFIKGDYRNIETLTRSIRGARSVIHLGGLVGDPACSYDEDLTIDINITSSRVIGEIAKANGVEKFLFASSCSVYGASNQVLDEKSDLNPVSLYAKSKIVSEKVLLELMDDYFSPVFLRFGTIYGLSGRTRFDLVVNLLTAKAEVDKKITVFGGDQWRPFVHVDDAAQGVFLALEADRSKVAGEAFNIGSNEQNYTLWEMGEIIKSIVPEAELLELGQDGDRRDYRVKFDKVRDVLGFKPKYSLQYGVNQVLTALRNGEISDYTDSIYSNVKHLASGGREEFITTYYSGWEKDYLYPSSHK